MGNEKRNRALARSVVVVGTVLAGVGLWAAVAKPPPTPTSLSLPDPGVVAAAPSVNPNFNQNDAFLTQPYVQSPPTVSSQPYQSQPVARPRFRTRAS